jgi:uncharacterized protein YndB with AHSA1/START domain
VHAFDARGGQVRNFSDLRSTDRSRKRTAHTDTYHGRFVALVPNERVVRIDEFETTNSALRGEMKITIELADKDGGTEVVGVHEGLPGGVSIGAAAKASKQTLSQWNRSTLHAAIQG